MRIKKKGVDGSSQQPNVDENNGSPQCVTC